MNLRIAPSILSADFARLQDEVQAVEAGGADLLHVDVMDGRFVPNLSIGVPVVEALARVSRLPLDVHLMIIEPERHIDAFAQAGASLIAVHVEASPRLDRTLAAVRRLDVQAGAALNPATPAEILAPVADLLDFVLVMSVNPGFSGQRFIPRSPAKVQAVRAMLDGAGSRAGVAVDGGIQPGNAAQVVGAGADVLVAASAIFGADDPAAATRGLRAAALAAPVGQR